HGSMQQSSPAADMRSIATRCAPRSRQNDPAASSSVAVSIANDSRTKSDRKNPMPGGNSIGRWPESKSDAPISMSDEAGPPAQAMVTRSLCPSAVAAETIRHVAIVPISISKRRIYKALQVARIQYPIAIHVSGQAIAGWVSRQKPRGVNQRQR